MNPWPWVDFSLFALLFKNQSLIERRFSAGTGCLWVLLRHFGFLSRSKHMLVRITLSLLLTKYFSNQCFHINRLKHWFLLWFLFLLSLVGYILTYIHMYNLILELMNDYRIMTHCWGQNNTFENTQAGKVFTGASKITTVINVSISDCLPFCSSIACADLYKVQLLHHPPHRPVICGWMERLQYVGMLNT